MPQKIDTDALSVEDLTPKRTAPTDLSEEINAAMQREQGETVRCVRVFDDNYRCNWWGKQEPQAGPIPTRNDLETTVMRVKRSSFLKVKRTAEGLSIQGVVSPSPMKVAEAGSDAAKKHI